MNILHDVLPGDMPHHNFFDDKNGDVPVDVFINFEDSMEQFPVSTLHIQEYDEENLDEDSHSITDHILSQTRKATFLTDWAFMSHGIFGSTEISKQNTVHSLKHVPSTDRHSNTFLVGVNLQSIILGTGVLGLPFCVKIAGVWALLLIALVGMATNFAAVIIGDCQYQSSLSQPGKSKRVHISYVQMAKICMNQTGAAIMKLLVYLSLFRNVIVIILLADLSQDILIDFGVTGYDKKLLGVAWTLASIPLLFISKVSYLAWLSFIGLNLYLCALVAMMFVCFMTYSLWDFSSVSWEFDSEGFGIALGIIINSYSVHMNLPTLEGSLKNPRHYKRTTYITFTFNNAIKIAMALIGYLSFGDATRQEIIGNITTYKPLPMVLRFAILFFTYFTIPMESFVAFQLLDETLRKHFHALSKKSWLLLSRLILMTLALWIAVLVPHFGLVVSLIGSVRGSIITLILPCTFYVMLKTHEIRLYKIVLCYVLMCVGTMAGLFGLYSSINALIQGKQF